MKRNVLLQHAKSRPLRPARVLLSLSHRRPDSGHCHLGSQRRNPEAGVTDTPAKSPIRVTILADSRLFCEGLRRICASDASLVVVGEANLATAREVVRTTTTDILLADGRIDGILTLCRGLRRDKARPWVILLAADSDDDWAMRALEEGARGILTKTATAEDFVKATHVVHEGQIWANKTVMARIVEALATLSRETEATQALLVQHLSSREQAIVRHAGSGLSNRKYRRTTEPQLGHCQSPPDQHLPEAGGAGSSSAHCPLPPDCSRGAGMSSADRSLRGVSTASSSP